jgi:hypothetical protein
MGLLSILLPVVLNLIKNYGVPLVEQKWPSLTPIINEILAVLGGSTPSTNLQSAAEHFNKLSASNVAVPSDLVK